MKNTFSLKNKQSRIVLYLVLAIFAIISSLVATGAWFLDRDAAESGMPMGEAVVVDLVGTGSDGTIQNFAQLYDSSAGAYPGDKILDTVSVKMGEKTEESVLRVQFGVNVLDQTKAVKTQDLTEAETNLVAMLKEDLKEKTTLFSSDWEQKGEWIYYKHLASGKANIQIFEEYNLPLPDSEMDNQYQALSFRISLVAEAIQAANILTYDEWNTAITSLSDSVLLEAVLKYNGERFSAVSEVLPYVETTGTQHINTQISPTLDTEVEITFSTSSFGKWLFGSRTSDGAADSYAANVSASNQIWFQMQSNSTSSKFSTTDYSNKQTVLKTNKDAVFVNGTQIGTMGRTSLSATELTLYLGALNQGGSVASNAFVGKIYSAKIWQGGKLVRHFVPARDTDNNVGFYDLVGAQMFLNAGSGNFAYGHSIVYMTNGGTLDASSPKSFVSGSLPITLKNPTREGYEFDGWFLTSSFSGTAQTTIPAGTDQNVYLYAKWIKTFNITYHLGGGTNNQDNPSSFTEKTLPITLKDPTREGYSFGGWFSNPTFSGDAETQIATGTQTNVSLWAKWSTVEKSVTYVLNGGTNDEKNVSAWTILDAPLRLYNPTQDGKTFEGWFASSDFSGDRVTYLSKEMFGDVTLYAQWADTHSITYHLGGGLNDGRNPKTFTKNTETITLFEPTRVNYTFVGWFDNEALSGTAVTQIEKGTETDVVLWAKWNSTQITVSFDATGGSVSPIKQIVEKDGVYGDLPTPTKAGYTFDGWYLIDEGYTEVEYIESTGTQYIDTGYYWRSDNTRVVLSANITETGNHQSLFGNQEFKEAGKSIYGVVAYIPSGSSGSFNVYAFNGGYLTASYALNKDIIVEISTSLSGTTRNVDYSVTQDGVTKTQNANPTADSVITNPNKLENGVGHIYLFANHNSGDGAAYNGATPNMNATQIVGGMKVYSFKMYDSGKLVRDFIPVVRTSDGAVGMLDLVEGKFHGNSGTGTFVAGPDGKITASSTVSTNVDHTLFAHWTENVYDITYHLDGGTNNAGNPATFSRTQLPVSLLDASKSGAYFAGWYLDSAFTKRVTKIDGGTLKDVDLWARFSTDALVFDLVGSSAYSVRAANTSISGSVVIPSTHNEKPVVVIQNSAFADCTNVTSVQIPTSVKSIGINAFENCTQLSSITIPEGVTLVPNNAFVGCSALSEVKLPKSVENIGTNAFAGCTQLTSIILPSEVSEIGRNAFGETSQYGEEIAMTSEFWSVGHYSSGHTSNSFETGNTFSTYAKIVGAQSETYVDTAWQLEMKNPISVVGGKTYVVSFYVKAENWVENTCFIVSVANWNSLITWSTGTQGLPNQLNFADDGQWHRLEFSVTAPSGATTMKVRLGADNPNIYGIGSSLEIAHFVISKPQTLQTVEVYADTPPEINGSVFPSSVQSIYVKAASVSAYKTAWSEYASKIVALPTYSITYNLNGSTNSDKNPATFAKYDLPLTLVAPTMANADFAGWYTSSTFSGDPITQITTAQNITLYARWHRKITITYVLNGGTNNASNASVISEADLPYTFGAPSRTSYVFVGWFTDEDLTNQITQISQSTDDEPFQSSITVYASWEELNPKLIFTLSSDRQSYSVSASDDISGNVIIPSAYEGLPVAEIASNGFYQCSSITSIKIPSSITKVGSYAFYNCSGLTKVNIKNLSAWFGITFVDSSSNPLSCAHHLYLNDVEITELNIPEDVTEIKQYTLYGATALTSVAFPKSMTNIDASDFISCRAVLESITVDSENTTYKSEGNCILTKDGKTLVFGCKNSVIPSSVTSIGDSAFYFCTGLTSITLPNGLKTIGSYAFARCTGLTQLYIPSSVTTISSSGEYNSPFNGCSSSLRIYCGASAKPSGWNSYWNYYSYGNSLSVTWEVAGFPQQTSEWKYIEKTDGTIAILSYLGSATSVTIPSSFNGKAVTQIRAGSFLNKSTITEITISSSVTEIQVSSFQNCTGLTQMYIPSSVTTISASRYNSPFYGCSSSLHIYCGAGSRPSGWNSYWNYYSSGSLLNVTWGATGLPSA